MLIECSYEILCSRIVDDIVAADADDLCSWKGLVESQLTNLTLLVIFLTS